MFTRLIASTLLAGMLLAGVPLLAHSQDNKAPADKALIVVTLPANATLTIEGDPTKLTGTERCFSTPSLKAGVTYSYLFAATWSEEGKEKKDSKKVTFMAGQTVKVAFGTPGSDKDKDKKKADEEKKKKDEEKKKADEKKKKEDDEKKKKEEAKKKADEEKKKKDDEKKKADDEKKKKMDDAYAKAIQDADKAVKAKKYEDAIKAYDAALKAKPGDKTATDLKEAAAKALDAEKKAAEAKKKADEEKKKKDDEAKKKKDEEAKKKADDEKKKDADEAKKKADEDKKKKDEEAKKKADEDKKKKDADEAKKKEEAKKKADEEAKKKADEDKKKKDEEAKKKADEDKKKKDADEAKKKADEAKKKKDEDDKKKKDEDDKKQKDEAKKDLLPPPSVETEKDKSQTSAKARTFDFTYEATITGLEKGKKAKVWVPVAQDNDAQQAKLLGHAVKSGEAKADGKIGSEKLYGNKMLFVETTPDDAGKIALKLSYRITRREVTSEAAKADMENADLIKRFLQPDALVPIDGKPLDLIKGKELPDDPMKKARLLYDVVNDHMTYSKDGKGWGRGDSTWACDSKFGNCSDFHSLFISLARSQKLPAKFEMGFPIPPKRGEGAVGGYHCWAFFRSPEGKSWVPVDVSEANKEPKLKDYFFGNLTEDRVTFTTGRDLTLEPKQSAKAVNFLIYPYVEIDGKEFDQAKIEKKFSYKDVGAKS